MIKINDKKLSELLYSPIINGCTLLSCTKFFVLNFENKHGFWMYKWEKSTNYLINGKRWYKIITNILLFEINSLSYSRIDYILLKRKLFESNYIYIYIFSFDLVRDGDILKDLCWLFGILKIKLILYRVALFSTLLIVFLRSKLW